MRLLIGFYIGVICSFAVGGVALAGSYLSRYGSWSSYCSCLFSSSYYYYYYSSWFCCVCFLVLVLVPKMLWYVLSLLPLLVLMLLLLLLSLLLLLLLLLLLSLFVLMLVARLFLLAEVSRNHVTLQDYQLGSVSNLRLPPRDCYSKTLALGPTPAKILPRSPRQYIDMLTQFQAHRKKTWSMFLFQMHSEVMWCRTKELLLWWIFRPLLAVHAPGSECDSDGGMAWGWWLGSSFVLICLITIIKSTHPYTTMPRYALLYILYIRYHPVQSWVRRTLRCSFTNHDNLASMPFDAFIATWHAMTHRILIAECFLASIIISRSLWGIGLDARIRSASIIRYSHGPVDCVFSIT